MEQIFYRNIIVDFKVVHISFFLYRFSTELSSVIDFDFFTFSYFLVPAYKIKKDKINNTFLKPFIWHNNLIWQRLAFKIQVVISCVFVLSKNQFRLFLWKWDHKTIKALLNSSLWKLWQVNVWDIKFSCKILLPKILLTIVLSSGSLTSFSSINN